jgi:putative exosortase-associated protein (TIGR04073 family)
MERLRDAAKFKKGEGAMGRKHFLTVIMVAVAFCIGASALQAGEEESKWEQRVDASLQQLGRGVANVLGGLFEIPANIFEVRDEKGDSAAITYGLFRGIWRFCVRETVGVFEIVTCPVGFEPIVMPEYTAEEGYIGALVEPEMSTADTPYPKWDLRPLKIKESK